METFLAYNTRIEACLKSYESRSSLTHYRTIYEGDITEAEEVPRLINARVSDISQLTFSPTLLLSLSVVTIVEFVFLSYFLEWTRLTASDGFYDCIPTCEGLRPGS